jgi:monoamine oxidase
VKRKEFIEKSLMMGIGVPLLTSVDWQMSRENFRFQSDWKLNGKVVIVGAGAAGMAAGFALQGYGIDFEILEATSVYGGRLKKAQDFADFPIDLGAEWIHVHPKVLAEIAKTSTISSQFETIEYNPQTIQTWNKNKLKSHNYVKHLYSEWKFKRSTWFDFFEQNILPEISDKISLNKPVVEINYEKDRVILRTADGMRCEADKVLVTVPIKILQNQDIAFFPQLPQEKTDAINSVFMGDGIKIFVEFKERFYPDILSFGNIFNALSEENKFVYDAAFKKDSDLHILGLFAINEKASPYTCLSDEEIISKFLGELDLMFDGQATLHYKKHIIQNWSKEAYIQGAYSYSFDGKKQKLMKLISEPLENRVFFAGEALSKDNQAMVQGACESAYSAVERMIESSNAANR